MKALVLTIFLLAETLGCEVGDYQFLRHSDCNKFSICLNGVLNTLRCENGLHWSERISSCLDPAYANCIEGAEISNDRATESYTECHVGQYLFLRHPECTKYQICINGVLEVSNCLNGFHWSISEGACLSPGIANCQPATTVAPEQPVTYPATSCIHGEYRRHPECTKFLHCSHGVLHVRNCADPLHWSVSKLTCDWPRDAHCKPITNADDPATTTPSKTAAEATTITPASTATEATTTTPATTATEATTTPSKTTVATTTKKTRLNKRCRHGEYLRHDDCGKFQQCSHGILYTMNCPASLHWYAAGKRCDWPYNANCTPRKR